MTKHIKLLIIMVLVLTVTASCTGPKHPTATEDYGINRADSIISDISNERNQPRVLAAIDSLEQAGELSPVKTIFYRTISYNLMGQRRTSLRLYHQLDNIDFKDLNTKVEQDFYVYSYNNYVRVLCDMKRYDRALRTAYAADRKLKAAGRNGFTDHHDIAQIIGECQLYLGQESEAAKSFRKSLLGVHTRLATYHDPLDYRECQKTMNAIANIYIEAKRYDEAAPWVHVQDSLFDIADKHPQRDSVFIDEMKADINYTKALLALGQGRTDDAERAFSVYRSTNLAKEVGSIISSNEYLLLTQRYEEATQNYQQLDYYLKANGYKADFENFGKFMIPKFRANLLAGHRDSALRVANIIVEYYDSALARQRRIDSDLLTTFYDTEGKERQIAEQRAELSQQRLFTVIIGTAVFVIFVIIYIIQHRRAYKKLDETNRQLRIANERAEESSRMKTKFIQQITHEVRTPLNVLSGFAQVLATPDIIISSDELQPICQKIVDNSDRITHLMDKMLDLSQINSNAEIECCDTVKPADIAQQAIEQSGIRQAAHLQLTVQLSPEAQAVSLVTNRKSAAKSLTLLLDNAAKFTHPIAAKGHRADNKQAHVTLDICATQQRVSFTVEDNGIGIPPEEAENIFTDFVQLDEYSDGTGIGLPIARSLARHMGGDIFLDTSYTNGARFVMTLPVAT